MPSGEDAWAFAWKASFHLETGGVVAFLLPAMGFLHNNAANSVNARNRFIQQHSIHRIINFADLRFQLFEHAHRPTALIIFGTNDDTSYPYRFDYWAPKADLNLKLKRMITLSSVDKYNLSSTAAIDNPLLFKQRLWMSEPDAKLFAYLCRLPKIGDLVRDYGGLSRRKNFPLSHWIIGQGFQPNNDVLNDGDLPFQQLISQYVGKLPNLPISSFRRVAQPVFGLSRWPSNKVRRKGFEAGFEGARILIPRGVETSQTRLRATYTEEAFTFQHIIQAITVPPDQTDRGKLLSALLNSRVAVWYAFHGTASFGSDRPEVKQADLLHLPFPSPNDLPEPEKAGMAAKELIAITDKAIEAARKPLSLDDEFATLSKIDHLAYEYFCLTDEEKILIGDTVDKIIPAVQPNEGSYPAVWKSPTEQERRAYANTLINSLKTWLTDNTIVNARLEASNADLGILCLSLDSEPTSYVEDKDISIVDVLSRISEHVHQPLNGNFQLLPNLRIFSNKKLYLIKPMQLRFWLRSSALADSDSIAMDLQDVIEIGRWRR